MARALPLAEEDLPDEDASELPRQRGKARSVAFWLAAAALACVAAVAAAGLLGGHTRAQTLYQRTLAIAGQYRCPVCAGESAASSDAPAAVEIRQLVRQWLEEGKSPAQIRSYLVADYGPSILEKPPASGLGIVVWALPALVVVLGAGGLAFAFYRWKKASGLAAAGGGAVPAGRLWQPRLFEVGGGVPRPGLRHAWRRARRLSLPVGVALVALALALFALDRFSAPELPGGTITGSLTGLSAELTEAQSLAAKDPLAALEIYEKVLARHPGQPIALSGAGWIYAEAGFSGRALSLLAEAEKADPSYGPAHLYRGLVLLSQPAKRLAAERELEWYLSHDPSPALAKVARRALGIAKAGARASRPSP